MEKLLDLKYTDVVGVTYDNDDGSSRQDILSTVQEMDSIELKYYLYNGAPAYSVHLADGRCIGHVSSFFASTVRNAYGDCRIDAYISKVKGGQSDLNYGCEIGVSFYGNEPTVDTPVLHESAVSPLDEKTLKRLRTNRVLFLFCAITFTFLGLVTLPIGIVFLVLAAVFMFLRHSATIILKNNLQ